MFSQNNPMDLTYQVNLYAFVHNSQPLSSLNFSPHDLVFDTRPRIPQTFDLSLNRNENNICIVQFSSQLLEQSHYDETDLKPFFTKTFAKPHGQFPFAVETAVLQRYSIVHDYTFMTNKFHAYLINKNISPR